MEPYKDPDHPYNGIAYHMYGTKCIEKGCAETPGTVWSPFWCFKHNVERMDRVSKNLEDLANGEKQN